MIRFIYKNLRHADYRLQAKEYKKLSHAIFNNDINNKEKTAWSKLVSVKWCDIHKEWYIKAWLSLWELIQSNLIKHLKEIHFKYDYHPYVNHAFKVSQEYEDKRARPIVKGKKFRLTSW